MSYDNQRPGVYSRYDITSVYTTPRSGGYAAVAAKAAGGEAGRVYAITTPAELREVFSPDTGDTAMYGIVQVLLASGVSKVLASVVEDGYPAALALLEGEENVAALVCDCTGEDDLLELADSVRRSADALRERVAYCGIDSPDDAIDAAGEINCERVVLCCPAVSPAGLETGKAVYGAAALAGRVLAQNDPGYNFSGEALPAVESPTRLAEEQIQALLKAGVTVLEPCGGNVECVRALTTRTTSFGEEDHSLRGLNTILCIDDVMRNVRESLKAVLRGSRISGRSLESIRSQVVVVLSGRQDAGVIESYEPPKCTADSSDPTVCIVELSFRVAHVVSQIHVTAHITL